MYHFSEEAGCRLATLLVLKGYNNVRLLTGGVEEYGALFKNHLEGSDVPNLKIPEIRKLNRSQTFAKAAHRSEEATRQTRQA